MKIKRDQLIQGFGRPDLLAILMVVTMVAFVGGAMQAFSRGTKSAVVCLANLRELQHGAQNYANDHGGLLLAGRETTKVLAQEREAWVKQTNELESEVFILNRSPLRPYVGGLETFVCPSAPRRIAKARPLSPLRSYSMSHVFDDGTWLPDTRYRTYAREGEIVSPERTFVFMEEHPYSLNDGTFVNVMVDRIVSSPQIVDFPANHHGGGAGMSFADGSAQVRRWRGKALRMTVLSPNPFFVPRQYDTAADMLWLSQHTTVRR